MAEGYHVVQLTYVDRNESVWHNCRRGEWQPVGVEEYFREKMGATTWKKCHMRAKMLLTVRRRTLL